MPGDSRSNIPPYPSIFIDREAEIFRIEEALATPDINAIIIYGVGGVGKTTLAGFVAERHSESNSFPGGVVWVDCTLDNSLPQILMTIAHTLGLESASLSSATLRDAIVSRLQSTPILLIFDNYEEVAQNDEVLSFIGRLPKATKALVVSRQRIRIPGRPFQIYLQEFTPIVASEYLRHSLDPKQWMEISQQGLLEDLYKKTGGLPLALALVSGMLNQGLPLTEVLAQLEEKTTSSDLAEYLLKRLAKDLPKEQQHFLDALSVFIHPTYGDAIASIAKVKNWHAVGQELEQLAFIQVVDGRYALHPLVRTYWHDQLTPDRLSLLQRRMVRYFLGYAKKFQADFDQLDREWPNIEYAIEIAYSDELWQEFFNFLLTLGQFFNARGYENEYLQWLNRAIEVSSRLSNRELTAALLHNLGVQYQQQGHLSKALEVYLQSLEEERAIKDRLGEANTLAQMGTIYHLQGDLAEAEEIYQKALQISRSLGDRRGESSLIGNLGLISKDMRRYEEAERLFFQALEITRQLGDLQTEANLLTNLGTIYRILLRLEDAIALFRQALEITRQLGDRQAEVNLLTNLGLIYTYMKWYSRAEENFQEAVAICRELGDRRAEANLLTQLGTIATNMERYEEAESLFRQALEITRELSDRRAEANLLTQLGTIATDMERYEEAESLFQEALTISHQIGDPKIEATLYSNLGTLYLNRLTGDRGENMGRAIDFYHRALQLDTKETNPSSYATLQHNLANAYRNLPTGNRSDNLEQALTHYQEALQIFTLQAFPLQWAATQSNLGTLYSQRLVGDHLENLKQAIAAYTQAMQVYTHESFPADWLRVITNLSPIYAEIGNWPEAKQLATNVLQVFHGTTADPETLEAIVPWYQGLGDLALQNQDTEFATRVFAEAAYMFELQGKKIPNDIHSRLMELKEKLGVDRFVIIWAEVQGLLTPALAQTLQDARQLMDKEQFKEAEEKLSKALEMLSKTEETKELWRQQGTILFMRGFCLRKQERWPEAMKDQEDAFKLFEKLRDDEGMARTLLEIGHLFEVMNNYEDARLHYMDAYSLYRRAGDKHGMALASENLGRLEYRVRMFPQAVQDLEEARMLYILLGERVKATSIDSDLEDAKASLAYQVARKEKRSENE
jgi:tetratricopeptide (TPR) repeat protein